MPEGGTAGSDGAVGRLLMHGTASGSISVIGTCAAQPDSMQANNSAALMASPWRSMPQPHGKHRRRAAAPGCGRRTARWQPFPLGRQPAPALPARNGVRPLPASVSMPDPDAAARLGPLPTGGCRRRGPFPCPSAGRKTGLHRAAASKPIPPLTASCQHLARLLIQGQAISQAIQAAIDAARDSFLVARISQGVQAARLPEPASRTAGVEGLLQQFGPGQQIEAQRHAAGGIVGAPRYLQQAASLEAHAIAGNHVAQIGPPFVGYATGQFAHIAQLAGFMPHLRQERRLAQRRVDAEFRHRSIQGRQKQGGALTGERHDSHQLRKRHKPPRTSLTTAAASSASSPISLPRRLSNQRTQAPSTHQAGKPAATIRGAAINRKPVAGSPPYRLATTFALSNRLGHHDSTAATSSGPRKVEMMMLEQKRINASRVERGHMNMKPSEVAAAPASTGTPNSLINAPPAAVVSMAMIAFLLEKIKNPP